MRSAMAIQCLPMTGGGKEEVYGLVDAAIAVIERSGLPYTVGPFETTVEGDLAELVALALAAHQAVLAAGAPAIISYIKLASGPELGTTEEKVRKYREHGH